jgi:hypothetical protein
MSWYRIFNSKTWIKLNKHLKSIATFRKVLVSKERPTKRSRHQTLQKSVTGRMSTNLVPRPEPA